jgi:hypothetical protein
MSKRSIFKDKEKEMAREKEKVYLITFSSTKPGATIADRSDENVVFAQGDNWYRGTFSIDRLFSILKPYLKKSKE